ncbi:MAG: hypothetical protein M0Z55_09180 [Peptococcaceae bacterium]|nr:hypothetical protein [Peptococcaceae bacterium]
MPNKILTGLMLVLGCTFVAVGCSTQQTPAPAPTATNAASVASVNTKVDNIVSKGLYRFGPPMMGVSDSYDNMYFAAKGGNWALADYMGDVMDDFMAPAQLTKASLYSQWSGFYKGNLGDGTALRKAIASKDFTAFTKAYTATMTNMCNTCHSNNGFKFIKKIQATSPAVDLDYTVKSDASENQ